MAIGMIIKWVGADKLIKTLTSKDTVGKPVEAGLKKIAQNTQRELVKATVRKTGTAKSNIAAAPIQYAQFSAIVTYSSGPGSSYIPYLETGTSKMAARHEESKQKVLGVGMFSYVKKWLAGKVDDAAKDIAKDIEDRI